MEPHQICSLIKAACVGAPSPLPHLVQSSHVFHSRPGRTAAVRAPGSQPMGHLALPRLLFPSLRVTDPPWGLPMTPPLGWAAAVKGGGGEVGRQDAVLEQQNCRLHWLLSAGSTKSWNVCFSGGSLHNKLPPNVMAENNSSFPAVLWTPRAALAEVSRCRSCLCHHLEHSHVHSLGAGSWLRCSSSALRGFPVSVWSLGSPQSRPREGKRIHTP